METITITKRFTKGKFIYSKRFDNYEKGFFGKRISKKEFEESKKENKALFISGGGLYIQERITYELLFT